MFDLAYPHGRWSYFRSRNLAELTDEVIDIVAANAARIASPHTAFPIFQLGGAVSRIGEDDTAYSGRGTGYIVNITGITDDAAGFDEERRWVHNFGVKWNRSRQARTSTF